jgi:hypothetical protein
MIYYVFSRAPSSDLIALLPPCFDILTCYKTSDRTYDSPREEKSPYLIVRISCTLIQSIHSVIVRNASPKFHHYYNSRSKRHSNFLFSARYFLFATPKHTARLASKTRNLIHADIINLIILRDLVRDFKYFIPLLSVLKTM